MCDCGDPEAWAKEGFCSKHRGIRDDFDASEILPASLYQSLLQTIGAVWLLTCDSLMDNEPNATLCLKWITSLCDYGECVVNIISKALSIPIPNHDLTPLDVIFKYSPRFSKDVGKPIHDLFMKLMIDYSFKRIYASYLGRYYSTLSDSNKLAELSVQVLTVPSIALDVVQKENVLENLLNHFETLLKPAIDQEGFVDCKHGAIENFKYWKCGSDLRYLFVNRAVSQFILFRKIQTFDLVSSNKSPFFFFSLKFFN